MNWSRESQKLTTFVTFDLSPCMQALMICFLQATPATPQAGLRPQRLFPVRWHSLAPEHSITPTAYGVKGKFPLCFQDC